MQSGNGGGLISKPNDMKSKCDLIKTYAHNSQFVYQILTRSVIEHSGFIFKTYCTFLNLAIELRFEVQGIQGSFRLSITRLLVTLTDMVLMLKMLQV